MYSAVKIFAKLKMALTQRGLSMLRIPSPIEPPLSVQTLNPYLTVIRTNHCKWHLSGAIPSQARANPQEQTQENPARWIGM